MGDKKTVRQRNGFRLLLDTVKGGAYYQSVTHVLDNAGLYIFRVRLFLNHGNLVIFSDILRFFYTISLSITRII